jgi:hypothetical protein
VYRYHIFLIYSSVVGHLGCFHNLYSRLVVRDFSFPLFGTQGTPPSLLRVFFVVIAYYSVFFLYFPWVGGRSVQEVMLIWPRVVCGSTTCHLAYLVVCVFPSHLGAAVSLLYLKMMLPRQFMFFLVLLSIGIPCIRLYSHFMTE